MKHFFGIAIFIFWMIPVLGQEADKIEKKAAKVESNDRLTFEFNYTDLLNQPEGYETRWFNRGMNVYLNYDIKLGSGKHFSFAPGIGFSTHNVYHNSFIERDTSATVFTQISDTLTYRNNKISTNFIEAPLELRFRSTPNKFNRSFKLAVGMRLGYLINAHTKYRGELDRGDGKESVKVKDLRLPNINNFRIGPSVRVGYGNLSLVGYYSLTTLFDKDRGPGVHPFSVGISFISF